MSRTVLAHLRPDLLVRLGAPVVIQGPTLLEPCDLFTLVLDVTADPGGYLLALPPTFANPAISAPVGNQVVLSLLYTLAAVRGASSIFAQQRDHDRRQLPRHRCDGDGQVDVGRVRAEAGRLLPLWQTWDPTTKTCVSTGVVLTTPGPGGAVGGAWPAAGASAQGLHRVKGTRGRTLVEASGALPAAYLGMTPAGMQAILNASFPGQYSNVAVVYPTATSLQVDYDYCGPTATVPSPGSVTDGAVTLTSTFSQIGTATWCGSSSMSKGTKIALGVEAGVVAAGAAWAGYRLYKGKSTYPSCSRLGCREVSFGV